jgi:glycosyltransferase involved in cell wall biosynthesis
MKFFSIIATDYEDSVPPEVLQRFIDSLKAQTFKDFEVIILHDGKRKGDVISIDIGDLDVTFNESLFRANLWGHNLRSYGMMKASGRFFIHTNTDNLYYPDALELLHRIINDQYPAFKVFINQVKMMGMKIKETHIPIAKDKTMPVTSRYYDTPRDYSSSIILTGDPPVWGNIDLMNLVAANEVWESICYWYDMGVSSDGIIYNKICTLYPYYYTSILIGEHY